MDKKSLSESDISDQYIRPAIVKAGWHTLDQIYAQYPLRAGRVVVRGKSAKRDQSTVLFADFVIFLNPNIPLAAIEAKKSRLSVRAGTAGRHLRQRPTASHRRSSGRDAGRKCRLVPLTRGRQYHAN